jgi:chaperonin GroES
MKPLYERVLIKPRKKETKTSGGILLPDKSVKRPNIGTVIACGDGSLNNPMLVKPGDLIICNRFAGAEITYKGELHYMIMSNEIMAILEDVTDVELDEFE